MAEHGHSELTGAGLIHAAEAALVKSGEQWTDLRADVFGALVARGQPVSAYDIAADVGEGRGRRVAANSIYRILDLFVRTNLANRIETANAYLVNSHPGCRHDCIFMICDGCGQASHFDDDRLTSALRDAGRGAGFAEVRPVVELRGRCEECAG